MSDTPRTDQRAFKAAFLPPEAIVTADFARELERDLNSATADLVVMQARVAAMQRCIDERTAERDKARRTACTLKARYMDSRIGFSPMTDDEANTEARKIAARMGWDCFDAPHANTTDVPVQNGGA